MAKVNYFYLGEENIEIEAPEGLLKRIGRYFEEEPSQNSDFSGKIKVEESIKLDDGKHEGVIEDVEYKSPQGYNYMDIVIKTKVKDKDINVKVSYPQNISANTALGKLLERFGAKLDIGKDLEPEEFLTKGKEIEFQTITEGKYYNVVLDSVKPK